MTEVVHLELNATSKPSSDSLWGWPEEWTESTAEPMTVSLAECLECNTGTGGGDA